MNADIFTLGYLAAAVLLILGIKGLAHPTTAVRGNTLAMAGMALAVALTFLHPSIHTYWWIIAGLAGGAAVGAPLAQRVQSTALPQLVALFNGLVGLAAACIGFGEYFRSIAVTPSLLGPVLNLEIALSVAIGLLTFTGSLIAAGKLSGTLASKPIRLPLGHISTAVLLLLLGVGAVLFTLHGGLPVLLGLALAALLLGVALALPIGGADMPVLIALFNAYSGWAGVLTGFLLENILLVIAGALVGASGTILTLIMCRAMNRSFMNVLLGGFGAGDGVDIANGAAGTEENGAAKAVQEAGVADLAFILTVAQKVTVVPGYGMAVAQAQHAVKEVYNVLHAAGKEVLFAIHPVAGRMPGHMNVLLAEADVPYDVVQEMDHINPSFPQTDVVLVIGANDVVNPDAKDVPDSPLYGMPILEAYKAKQVYVIKRSRRSGYSGVDNALFYRENTWLVFGDAKDVCEKLGTQLKALG